MSSIAEYQKLAREQQQEMVIEIKAPRGAILDRYGQRLAMSLPAESVLRRSVARAGSLGGRRYSFASSESWTPATCWPKQITAVEAIAAAFFG